MSENDLSLHRKAVRSGMDKLALYMQYPFVRYALIVGVLIALCSSLLGVTLVLKRFSFIGDGLSHVAFGAMAVAAVFGLTNEMMLVLPVTVVSAVLLLRTGKNTKIKGDAAIAMISVAALAFGYLIMNIFSASSNLTGDVCSTLFGSTSILTLTSSEVWICTILSVVVVIIFVLYPYFSSACDISDCNTNNSPSFIPETSYCPDAETFGSIFFPLFIA